jgi:hypothetical protein
MKTYLVPFVLSIVMLLVSIFIHLSRMPTSVDPDAPRSPAGPGVVTLNGKTPAAGQPSGVIILPEAEAAPMPSPPPPAPVYDEIRELEADEAYDHLYSVAFDERVARRHLRDFDLIARDAGLPEELRRLAVWGLAQGGDLESIRSQLAGNNAPGVELTALEMLRRHEGAAASDLIAARAREARDPSVREAALRSLGHTGGSIDPSSRPSPSPERSARMDTHRR